MSTSHFFHLARQFLVLTQALHLAFCRLDVPYDCSVELSPSGYQFLTEIFELFDQDEDGALSESELAALFSTSPGNPWIGTSFPNTTVTSTGKVTLQGWLAQWRFVVSLPSCAAS